MHDFQEQCQVHGQRSKNGFSIRFARCDRCVHAFVVIFFKTMYNKTIIKFGLCDIRNNQGLG